jgi:hypothetical protein
MHGNDPGTPSRIRWRVPRPTASFTNVRTRSRLVLGATLRRLQMLSHSGGRGALSDIAAG